MNNANSEQSRRRFLGQISKAGLLGMAGLKAPAILPPPEQVQPAASHTFSCKPYLQYPAPGSISINWLTARPCYSWVEYGTNGQLNLKAHHVTNGLVDANSRFHRVRLDNLEPGQTYQYKVLSKDILSFEPYKLTYGETIESPVYSFTAINPQVKEVSWLILNDIHDRPASIPHLINLNGKDPYDFVFLNGDMFDYQSGEQQIIDHLLNPCGDTFSTRQPFMYVRGNHETRGKYARQWHDYFDNPYYFSFQVGPVAAIVLDTGEDKEDNTPVYAGIVDFDNYRQQQAVWLEQQLQSKAFRKARYKVVMMHIPHYHSGDWHGVMHCRQLFGPLFNKHKIDILICGHTHKYGIHEPVKGEHDYPLIIGGGPQEGKRTLIKIKADQQQFKLEMLRDDGVKVGEYTLR